MELPLRIYNFRRSIPSCFLVILAVLGTTCLSPLKAQTVATPTISPSTNSSYVQFNVTISDSTAGASIHYTLDGTTPTTSSTSITSGGSVLIAKTETLSVKAFLSGYTASYVASASYTLGQVVAGQYHTVALKSDGSLWAWGLNTYGEVGDNTTIQRNSAVPVTISGTPLTGIIAVAAGAYHSVALKSDNTVLAWGLNSSGQCGDNTVTERNTPVQVQKSNGSGGTTNLNNIVAISVGEYHNLALDSSGHVWAWGLNSNGQLGDGTTTQQNLAEDITANLPSGTVVQELFAGGFHSLLLTTSGVVLGWGMNTYGELGDGTTMQRNSAVTVTTLSPSALGSGKSIVSLAGGSTFSLALENDGTVWGWGYNVDGEVGDNSTTNRSTPVHLTSFAAIGAIAAGYTQSLAIQTDGTVWSWGLNSVGELGDGTAVSHKTPYHISTISGATLITAGNEDSLVLKNDGTLYTFGADNCGQLGDGASMLNSNALQVLGLSNPISKIAAGCSSSHGLALDTSNQVWAWGNNANGQLGDNTQYERVNPIAVTFSGLGSATISQVAANGNRSMALDSSGKIWSWGQGSIGNGGTGDAFQPVQLSNPTGVTQFAAIAEAANTSMAIDSNYNLWGWGANGYGEVGDGTTTTRNSPVQVKNYTGGTGTYLSGVTAVCAGDGHFLALAGGVVYAWGNNNDGQLGDGTTTNRSLPTAVTGLPAAPTTIVAIAAGGQMSAAVDSTGHVWMWGYNASAQLGIGNTTSQHTPVEVTLTGGADFANVVAIRCGTSFSSALKSDGTVWSWGIAGSGEVANGILTPTLVTRPVQDINLSGVIDITTGYHFGIALKQDGSLQSWGFDGNGGIGAEANYAVPNTIPGFNAFAVTLVPTVSITAPVNNTTLALGGSTTFTASASETGGMIASVKYYVNSTLVGTATTGSTYSFTWTPSTWGNFTFTAIATDTLGSTSYLSPAITIEVPYDSDSNGLPDWWEIKYLGNIGTSTGYNSSTILPGSSLTLLQDFQQGIVPVINAAPPSSGMALWLKADAGVTADGNGKVSQWNDQSSLGNNAVQPSSGNQPSLIPGALNGKPAISFNGSTSNLSIPDNSSLRPANITMIAVAISGAQSDFSHIISKPYYNTNSWNSPYTAYSLTLHQDTTPYTECAVGGTDYPVGTALAMAPEQPHLLSATYDGATEQFREDGQAAGSISVSGSIDCGDSTTKNVVIGSASANWNYQYFNGQIAEVLIYNRALSSTELQQAEGYLADKYGLYDPNATWYNSSSYLAIKTKILQYQWNKKQADAYLAFVATSPPVASDGLVLWLKADVGASVIADPTSHAVSQWLDQSPNGNNAVASAANQPTLNSAAINGKPAISFSGTSSFLTIPDNLSLRPSTITILAVATCSGGSDYQRLISKPYSYSTSWVSPWVSYELSLDPNSVPYLSCSVGGANTRCGFGSFLNSGTPYLLTGTYDGTNQSLYQNGLLASALVPLSGSIDNGDSSRKDLVIGSSSANWPYQSLNGQIAEVLVYNRALTSAERQQAEIYLANKYGIFYGLPPTITPNGGSSSGSQSVTISTPLTTGSIHYTLDGTEPTPASPNYSTSITLTGSAFVSAEVFSSSGQPISSLASAQFYVNDPGNTGLPTKATGLAVTAASSSELDLAWTLSGQANYYGIAVYRSTNGGPYVLLTVLDSPAVSYSDLNVVVGNSYTYEVGTINQSGIADTAPSGAVTPPASANLSITVTSPAGTTPLP